VIYVHSPICSLFYKKLITVTERSKARNVFAYSNTGIVGSIPTLGMDGCLFSVFVLRLAEKSY
jgi:hypothetical protein